MNEKVKAAHDSLMRWGFCALWMAAFIFSFYGFLDVSFADDGSPEQTAAGLRFIAMLGVGIAATSAHGYLVHLAKKPQVRVIKYWLVRKIFCGRNPRDVYFCLTSERKPALTSNAKLAMRWVSREGAEQTAQSLGDWWAPVEVSFPGNELCAVTPRHLVN